MEEPNHEIRGMSDEYLYRIKDRLGEGPLDSKEELDEMVKMLDVAQAMGGNRALVEEITNDLKERYPGDFK